MKAWWTARRRSQDRAIGVVTAEKERGVDCGAVFPKVCSKNTDSADCSWGRWMRVIRSWRKASREDWKQGVGQGRPRGVDGEVFFFFFL